MKTGQTTSITATYTCQVISSPIRHEKVTGTEMGQEHRKCQDQRTVRKNLKWTGKQNQKSATETAVWVESKDSGGSSCHQLSPYHVPGIVLWVLHPSSPLLWSRYCLFASSLMRTLTPTGLRDLPKLTQLVWDGECSGDPGPLWRAEPMTPTPPSCLQVKVGYPQIIQSHVGDSAGSVPDQQKKGNMVIKKYFIDKKC